MKKIIINSIFFLPLAILIAACRKDKSMPVITISKPSDGAIVQLSLDSIHMIYTVTDNAELHNITTKISDASGTVLYSDVDHEHKSNFSYHEHFMPNGIVVPTPLVFSVVAEDHEGNTSSKTINFSVKP